MADTVDSIEPSVVVGWDMQDVLLRLGAVPGEYLTHIIMVRRSNHCGNYIISFVSEIIDLSKDLCQMMRFRDDLNFFESQRVSASQPCLV